MDLRFWRLNSWSRSVALVAAYMFVVQSLIGAFALGASAAPTQLDAFGNPLCITSSETADKEPDRGSHSSLPDCCTVACNMFAPVTPDERVAHSLVNRRLPVSQPLQRPFRSINHARLDAQSPGSPRSPPLTS